MSYFYRYRHQVWLSLLLIVVWTLTSIPAWAAFTPQADVYLWFDGRGQTSIAVALNFEPEHVVDLTPYAHQAFGAKVEPLENPNVKAEGALWMLQARSNDALKRHGLMLTGAFSPAPLLHPLRQMGVERATIQVVQPPAAFSSCEGALRRPISESNGLVSLFPSTGLYDYSASDAYFYSDIDVLSSQNPAPLNIAYGYRNGDVLKEIGPLLGVLLLGIGIALWGRVQALRAQQKASNAGMILFGYSRFLNRLSNGIWLSWIALAMQSNVHTLINFALGVRSILMWLVVTPLVLMWPPILAIAFNTALSFPVFQNTGRVRWTRSELVRQIVWGHASWMLPLIFGLTGLIGLGAALIMLMFPAPNVARLDWKVAALLLVAALISYIMGRRELHKAIGGPPQLQRQPITEGDLHERVMALASQAGVAIKQLSVLSTQKHPQANACVTDRQMVLLTDYLLEQFTRREVDAVVAHELTHLKGKHINGLVLSGVFIGFIGAIFVLQLSPLWASWEKQVPFLIPVPTLLIIWVVQIVQLFLSRRLESAADVGAVDLTGDAEAYITMLAKITELNLLPMEWGRWQKPWMSHPSTRQRIEAVGQHTSLSPERVETILARLSSPVNPSTEDRYLIPVASQP